MLLEQITGQINRVIFRNEQNGWTVMEITDDTGEEIAVVGSMPLCAPGERVQLSGKYVHHPTYGRQFKAEGVEMLAPATQGALVNYLGSGLIKGVGEATARAIVAHFGEDTLHMLAHTPERLREISGIGRKRAADIAASFQEQAAMREIMIGMQAYGITVRQTLQLYQRYGEQCLQRVEEDPYRLVEEIEGIGFKTADKIAMRMGIEPSSRTRLRAGVTYMLLWARQEGHTYLPRSMLLHSAAELLGQPEDAVEEALDALIIENTLQYAMVGETDAVYLPALYYMERDCARRLLPLARPPEEAATLDIARELVLLENMLELSLAPQQREAVINALTQGAMVITGGPGTGKTTIIQFVLRVMQRLGMDFALCAPTGRAAKRMTEATGFDASTIHRLLEFGGEGQPVFARNEENPLFYDMIVVDEMSMVDLPLFYALLRALPPGTRLIMVGDADQLPPVGAGTVLHDIIESKLLCVVRLTEIFRQAGRSGIACNAQCINEGQPPQTEGYTDFQFLPTQSIGDAMREVLRLCTGEGTGYDPFRDIQVLAPMKKGPLGVHALNASIQQALNPPAPEKAQREYAQTVFREGDKVMQIRNNYKLEWMRTGRDGNVELGCGAYNGDLGTIYRMDQVEQTLDVLFDDERMARYEFAQLEELELAYCISIHKSQGSEFPLVVLPLFQGPPILMTRNLLYTAVTRARAQVILIGSWHSVMQMVENKRTRKRYSALDVHMKSLETLLEM